MTDIDAIVAGLSKGAREALINAELDSNVGRYFSRFILWPVGKALIKGRLGTAVWSGVMINERGLAVRTRLMEQANAE